MSEAPGDTISSSNGRLEIERPVHASGAQVSVISRTRVPTSPPDERAPPLAIALTTVLVAIDPPASTQALVDETKLRQEAGVPLQSVELAAERSAAPSKVASNIRAKQALDAIRLLRRQ